MTDADEPLSDHPLPVEDRFLDWLGALSFEQLPSEVVANCEAALIDHLCAALFGADLPWVRGISDVVLAGICHSEAGAPVYGSPDRIPARLAALVNATASHGFELDDVHFPTLAHPGSVTCAAAMAVAAACGGGGQELLTAIAAGYETIGRVGLAVGVRHSERGFHSAAIHGPLGSAAAAAKAYSLDAATVRDAVAISTSFSAGIKAFQHGSGSIKRLHAGRAAESGVLAAELARGGLKGPIAPLTGRFGYIPIFAVGEAWDAESLTRDLGESWAVSDVYLKPFSSCGANHGAMSAAELIGHAHKVNPADVTRVLVHVSKRTMKQNNAESIADIMTAQYSVRYGSALGLLDRLADPRRYFDLETGADGDVRALMAKMTVVHDPSADAAYPNSMNGRVEVQFEDGTVLTESARACSAERPLRPVSARDKFRRLLGQVGGTDLDSLDAVLDAVAALKDGGPASDVLEAMTAIRSPKGRRDV